MGDIHDTEQREEPAGLNQGPVTAPGRSGALDESAGADRGRDPAPSAAADRRSEQAPASRRLPLRQFSLAIVSLLAAGLVLPAATKQWSDRTQELELKKELLSQMSEASTTAIDSSYCIVLRCEPEEIVSRQLSDPTLLRDAAVAGQRRINETLSGWSVKSARIGTLLKAYFPGSSLLADWEAHAEAVTAFTRLGTSNCGPARLESMRKVESRVPEVMRREWSGLLDGIGATCQLTPASFEDSYLLVGDALEKDQQSLGDQVLKANTNGYSTGFGDFFKDLYPF